MLIVPNCFVEGVSAMYVLSNNDKAKLKEVPGDKFTKITGYGAVGGGGDS